MANNQRANPPTGHLPSGPGASHTPTCGCCLAYQALKSRERVRQTMILMHGHKAGLSEKSARSKVDNILVRLAQVCIEYEDAERAFIHAAKSKALDLVELRQAALKLAGEVMAEAGRRLASIDDDILGLQGFIKQPNWQAIG
jgi:hypothetical protein